MAFDPEKGIVFPHLDFSATEPSLINPTREPGEALVSPRVILAFTRPDYHYLCRLANSSGPPRYLWDCAMHEGSWEGQGITIIGPVLGAPYAAMVLERLIVLGAKAVLALGWCGSLQEKVKVGSLVVPTGAVSGDGTSRHYLPGETQPEPHPELCRLLQSYVQKANFPRYCGTIWTTDAFYRETAEQVRHYQAQGVLGVDLELAALFAAGQYRRVAVAGLLVVSDELGDLTWRPDFRSPVFRQARKDAARAVLNTVAAVET